MDNKYRLFSWLMFNPVGGKTLPVNTISSCLTASEAVMGKVPHPKCWVFVSETIITREEFAKLREILEIETNDPERYTPPKTPKDKISVDDCELGPGLYYGGRGPGGEYYTKDVDGSQSDSIWVREENDVRWTPEDLEKIAADMRKRAQPKS